MVVGDFLFHAFIDFPDSAHFTLLCDNPPKALDLLMLDLLQLLDEISQSYSPTVRNYVPPLLRIPVVAAVIVFLVVMDFLGAFSQVFHVISNAL